jgi:radical SAM protein with 4Fe4S-binding SPASM domain
MSDNKFPLFQKLLIELQSNCNRNCFFCNRPGDTSGKRFKNKKRVIQKMPSTEVVSLLVQAYNLGFRGHVAFHHMSEAFLDDRIIQFAKFAKILDMHPYAHSNGDRLKKDKLLCREAAKVFEYMVIGLYDYKNKKERREQEEFWKNRLKWTKVKFSYVGKTYPRAYTKEAKKITYPNSVCSRPFVRLIVHYDGGVALCCEDMEEKFKLGNAFETSIKDIWFSEKHVKIVKNLNIGGRQLYPLCKSCPIKPNRPRKGVFND